MSKDKDDKLSEYESLNERIHSLMESSDKEDPALDVLHSMQPLVDQALNIAMSNSDHFAVRELPALSNGGIPLYALWALTPSKIAAIYVALEAQDSPSGRDILHVLKPLYEQYKGLIFNKSK